MPAAHRATTTEPGKFQLVRHISYDFKLQALHNTGQCAIVSIKLAVLVRFAVPNR